jgi:hypothetical protein
MTLKEKIKVFETKHPGLLRKLGIGFSILMGVLILLVVLFSLKDKAAVAYGSATNIFAKIKFWSIVIGVIILIGTLVKNIITGGFSLTKFIGGFNIFAGPVQGKLIYYGVIFAVVAAVSFGLYHRITQETFETNYKNQIKAEQVIVDQKTIYPVQDDALLIGIKIFGLKLGITIQSRPKPIISINNGIIGNGKKSINNITHEVKSTQTE